MNQGRGRALTRAQRRIAELEREIREIDAPPPPASMGWLALGLAGPAGLAVLGLAAFVFAHRPPPPPPTPPPAYVETPAPPPAVGARWYPQANVSPIVVDVDGDGVQDFIGLGWATTRQTSWASRGSKATTSAPSTSSRGTGSPST